MTWFIWLTHHDLLIVGEGEVAPVPGRTYAQPCCLSPSSPALSSTGFRAGRSWSAPTSVARCCSLPIPAAAVAGRLRIEQLYAVAFLEAALGSFFDTAYRSYLPSLPPRDRLVEANAKIGTTGAIAELGGPALAGALVQVITAPMAIGVLVGAALAAAFGIRTAITVAAAGGFLGHALLLFSPVRSMVDAPV